jgi:hypothetical protein|tara:strand:+ start:646 stop:810 length:165 start_codon:yes stop_codon:yes gene_type:complete
MTPATILERLYQRAEDTADDDHAAEELNMLQEAMIMLAINCNDWYNGTIKGNGP